MEIKKKETLDAVQELQAAYKRICFPKDRSKSGPSEEPPQWTAFNEPYIFNIKKKHKEPIDLIVKGKFFGGAKKFSKPSGRIICLWCACNEISTFKQNPTF